MFSSLADSRQGHVDRRGIEHGHARPEHGGRDDPAPAGLAEPDPPGVRGNRRQRRAHPQEPHMSSSLRTVAAVPGRARALGRHRPGRPGQQRGQLTAPETVRGVQEQGPPDVLGRVPAPLLRHRVLSLGHAGDHLRRPARRAGTPRARPWGSARPDTGCPARSGPGPRGTAPGPATARRAGPRSPSRCPPPAAAVSVSAGAEDHVAALDVGGHVGMPERGHDVAQVRHRDLVVPTEVDPAQQRDVSSHATTLARRPPARIVQHRTGPRMHGVAEPDTQRRTPGCPSGTRAG